VTGREITRSPSSSTGTFSGASSASPMSTVDGLHLAATNVEAQVLDSARRSIVIWSEVTYSLSYKYFPTLADAVFRTFSLAAVAVEDSASARPLRRRAQSESRRPRRCPGAVGELNAHDSGESTGWRSSRSRYSRCSCRSS
jgi:hypothetical protein